MEGLEDAQGEEAIGGAGLVAVGDGPVVLEGRKEGCACFWGADFAELEGTDGVFCFGAGLVPGFDVFFGGE